MRPSTTLLTTQDVCRLLACSRSTLWRRVEDATVPRPLKFGRLSRWRAEDIEAVIATAAAGRSPSKPVVR